MTAASGQTQSGPRHRCTIQTVISWPSSSRKAWRWNWMYQCLCGIRDCARLFKINCRKFQKQHSQHSIQPTTHLATRWGLANAQCMDSQVIQMNLNTKWHNTLLNPIMSRKFLNSRVDAVHDHAKTIQVFIQRWSQAYLLVSARFESSEKENKEMAITTRQLQNNNQASTSWDTLQ